MIAQKNYTRTRPSFLTGMARVLDLGGTLDEYGADPISDAQALAGDWGVISGDFWHAYQSVAQDTSDDVDGPREQR
jgi:hypothetical protein